MPAPSSPTNPTQPAGAAAQKLSTKLSFEQEILMNSADMIIELYMAESVLLRAEKSVADKGEASSELYIDIAKTYLFDATLLAVLDIYY